MVNCLEMIKNWISVRICFSATSCDSMENDDFVFPMDYFSIFCSENTMIGTIFAERERERERESNLGFFQKFIYNRGIALWQCCGFYLHPAQYTTLSAYYQSVVSTNYVFHLNISCL